MASLKELRSRISSVAATQKITRALQMVAVSKFRRAREAAENARPYAERMAAVIANLAAGVSGPGAPAMLVGTGSTRRELVVVATADRGLAGGFNGAIVRAAREHISARIAEGREVSLITIGRKARDQLRRQFGDRLLASIEAGTNPTFEKAQEAAALIMERFDAGQADVVTLIFSRFVSTVSQKPTLRQLIPAEVETGSGRIDLKGAAYEYEPEETAILETLLPRNLTTQILAALMENQAGFFASQMAAMDNATRNAGEMIARLTLIKNRTRQAQITKELIEIISGAEAL
ncbi:MAG: F0F1 ATP synthase subunit gamma [Alphaproteobacteria bacterium]|jgi:F-type H+-transporting ATPase subunit gamma|nr:F0F1 ATP synthase subunit gamma [Alphaproteobacteria bacterium]